MACSGGIRGRFSPECPNGCIEQDRWVDGLYQRNLDAVLLSLEELNKEAQKREILLGIKTAFTCTRFQILKKSGSSWTDLRGVILDTGMISGTPGYRKTRASCAAINSGRLIQKRSSGSTSTMSADSEITLHRGKVT